MSQQTIVISGYTKCFTNVNSVGILGVLPVLFTNLNYVVAGEVLWMNGGEITKGPYHQRCLCWNLLTRRILRRLPWPTTTIRTPFHSLLGTPKTALSRIPFPKTQSDSSIEDVSLKPTRQEAVKKEPKSNATWDYWPLKCTKMTLSEKNWEMWDLEVDLRTVCQNCYSKWGGSRAFCDKHLQLCHLFVDSKAYGLPSYITTWLLKRWLLALVYSPWIPRFSKSSWREGFWSIMRHPWIPKIQLFWATPTGNCPSILQLGCLWTLDWGFWNIQQNVEMEWMWLDYFTNMNLPLHYLKTALIWPT